MGLAFGDLVLVANVYGNFFKHWVFKKKIHQYIFTTNSFFFLEFMYIFDIFEFVLMIVI